jgi:hypothetical protein
MRRLRSTKDSHVFGLSAVERGIFQEILKLYPLVPTSHQPLSKSMMGGEAIEAQQMLDEALAEQRVIHKKQIQEWLGKQNRFRATKSGFNFTLRRDETEWLLQILNDVRIGSWLLLGSPEEQMDPDDINPELHRVWAAMEVSGMFQVNLLQATSS